ncbi:PadR family transcriptional regulator [Luedemannella flava]|uniref:PadR family transcriptional regulator n=1 Tax=Luedemannella flava TaxID=349316 RepID=UPI0031E43AC6
MDLDRRNQWLRGILDLCVLALLARDESYGYELGQALERAGLGAIQGGTLYPVLLRLQRTGCVTTRWQEGDGGPARKYYRITDAGRDCLARDGEDWLGFAASVAKLLDEGGGP